MRLSEVGVIDPILAESHKIDTAAMIPNGQASLSVPRRERERSYKDEREKIR